MFNFDQRYSRPLSPPTGQSPEDHQNVQSSFSSWHPDSKAGKCLNRLPWYAAKQDHAGPVEASRTLSLTSRCSAPGSGI